MRVLVTGGAGFIGSHVVPRLLADAHQVLVIDDLSSGRADQVPPRARLEIAALAAPEAARATSAFAPEVVVHLAAPIDAGASLAAPEADARGGLLDSLRVLERARAGGRPHVVFASSAAVYGGIERLPSEEGDAGRPSTPYGVGKLTVERYLHFYDRVHGMSSTSLRFANVYGERQTSAGEGGVVAIFCRELLAGRAPRLFGGGTQTRDFVHAADVAEAVARAVAARPAGAFNVASTSETSIRELAGRLIAILAPGLAATAAAARPGDPPRSCLSYAALARAVGWRPRVSLDEGLARTAAWFRERAAAG
jgi:UDP-glucose 4-epimerase